MNQMIVSQDRFSVVSILRKTESKRAALLLSLTVSCCLWLSVKTKRYRILPAGFRVFHLCCVLCFLLAFYLFLPDLDCLWTD